MKKMLSVLCIPILLSACASTPEKDENGNPVPPPRGDTFLVEPEAGEEAVLVAHPWFFGSGGIYDTPVTTGSAFKAPSTTAIYVNIQPQEWDVKFEDLMSRDGVPLHFDATIVLRVTNSVGMIREFGQNWYENNVDSVFRNYVRQAVRKYGMNEIAIDTAAVDAVDKEVTEKMQAYVTNSKIPVVLVRLTVGKVNPPDSVRDQRVETAKQEQRKETEIKTQDAEVSRKQEEEARADADNAYRNKLGLTSQEFVELERIKMMRDTCIVSDKNPNPCTFIIGNGTPIVNTK